MPHPFFDAPNQIFFSFLPVSEKDRAGTSGRADGGDLDVVEALISFARSSDEIGPRRAGNAEKREALSQVGTGG